MSRTVQCVKQRVLNKLSSLFETAAERVAAWLIANILPPARLAACSAIRVFDTVHLQRRTIIPE